MDNEFMMNILELIIAIVFGAVGRYLIPCLKAKLESEKGKIMADFALKAVRAVEQIITTEKSGEEKRDYVAKLIAEKAKKERVNLTEEQIRILIEDAWTAMNK